MDQFCIEVFMFHSRHEDRLCIAQHDLALKAEGIRGLGCFLAKSRNLTILWSGRYFSRLSLGEIFRLRFVKVSKVWCFVTVLSGFFRKKSFPIPIALYRTFMSQFFFDLQMATGSRSYFSSKVLDSPRWCLYELAYYLKDETAMDRRNIQILPVDLCFWAFHTVCWESLGNMIFFL